MGHITLYFGVEGACQHPCNNIPVHTGVAENVANYYSLE